MKTKPFKKIIDVLVKVGLPTLGTAIGGPAGGVIAGTLGGLLGADPEDDALAEALEKAGPETVAKLREIDASIKIAESDTDRAEIEQVKAVWESDNASGHWLPANVRPLVLLILLGFFILWTVATGIVVVYFFHRNNSIDESITGFFVTVGLQITGFLTTVTLAYFGARSFDKRTDVQRGA
jgi:hypothetical protein